MKQRNRYPLLLRDHLQLGTEKKISIMKSADCPSFQNKIFYEL